jgi:hypothetical protein
VVCSVTHCSLQPAKFLVKYAAPPTSRDPVRMGALFHWQQHLNYCACCFVFQETFIDPFEGGRFLSRTELQDILLHIVPDPTNPEYLRSIRNRDVWHVVGHAVSRFCLLELQLSCIARGFFSQGPRYSQFDQRFQGTRPVAGAVWRHFPAVLCGWSRCSSAPHAAVADLPVNGSASVGYCVGRCCVPAAVAIERHAACAN